VPDPVEAKNVQQLATGPPNGFGEFLSRCSAPTIGCPTPPLFGAFRQPVKKQMEKFICLYLKQINLSLWLFLF
jgi:hypothetical protein